MKKTLFILALFAAIGQLGFGQAVKATPQRLEHIQSLHVRMKEIRTQIKARESFHDHDSAQQVNALRDLEVKLKNAIRVESDEIVKASGLDPQKLYYDCETKQLKPRKQ